MVRIRRRGPKTRILLRGDSGFAREVLMAWCEANRVDNLFGLARNARLEETVKAELIAPPTKWSEAEISEITRQRVDWQRAAARDLAEGRFGEAVAAFDRAGAITWTQDHEDARTALVASWKRDTAAEPDATRFVFAYTNVDVDALNAGWAEPTAIDSWSQFILKDTADKVELITEAPKSGIWRLDPSAHGGIRFVRRETDWHTVEHEDEAFYLLDGSMTYSADGQLHRLSAGSLAGCPGNAAWSWFRLR